MLSNVGSLVACFEGRGRILWSNGSSDEIAFFFFFLGSILYVRFAMKGRTIRDKSFVQRSLVHACCLQVQLLPYLQTVCVDVTNSYAGQY